MMTLLDLARTSAGCYPTPPADVEGWTKKDSQLGREGGFWNDLQAVHYVRSDGSGQAVAFRGTNLEWDKIGGSLQDLAADGLLGIGFNTDVFGAAVKFVQQRAMGPDLVVCGHSLGGAVAQIVGNRLGLRIATYNAPGVAALASRNMKQADPAAAAGRTVGMTASALLHPIQAVDDMKAAFAKVKGINLRLEGDIVSKVGVHYGQLQTIPGPPGAGPAKSHYKETVIECLTKVPDMAKKDIKSFN